jgi:CcmD family protein
MRCFSLSRIDMIKRGVRGTLRRWAAIGALLAGLGAAPSLASAQQPPEPPAGFVPADSLPQQEQLPAAPLVIAAYAVAWVLVFGYLWTIWQRLGRVERELGEVRRRVEGGARR